MGFDWPYATHVLDKIAEESHGAPDYVTPKENIEVKVSNFYGKVSSPVLADLNGDGLPDLIEANSDAVNRYYLNRTNTTTSKQ